jgi:hypothetical protein
MARAKRVSTRWWRDVPLGIAGMYLTLTGGASTPTTALPSEHASPSAMQHPQITLREEEIFDVSLCTFYVFDREDAFKVAAKGTASGPPARATGPGASADPRRSASYVARHLSWTR